MITIKLLRRVTVALSGHEARIMVISASKLGHSILVTGASHCTLQCEAHTPDHYMSWKQTEGIMASCHRARVGMHWHSDCAGACQLSSSCSSMTAVITLPPSSRCHPEQCRCCRQLTLSVLPAVNPAGQCRPEEHDEGSAVHRQQRPGCH